MKFGKVEPLELDRIDFRLPDDHADNADILSVSKTSECKIHFGCTGWGNKDWIGSLYPKGTKAKDFLSIYGRQFESVELNSTHYRIPTIEQVVKWKETTSSSFTFCPKIYQAISHWDRLNDTRGTTTRFCDAICHFEDRLGPSFLQMHPSFKSNSADVLEAYLKKWPSGIPLALELRAAEWYGGSTADRLFDLLRTNQVLSIITDTAGYRELVHMRLSAPKTMIRFVGNQLHPSDYSRIDAWVHRLKEWATAGLEECWFFMHQHEELHSPMLIKYMADQLQGIPGISVQSPDAIETQGSLF